MHRLSSDHWGSRWVVLVAGLAALAGCGDGGGATGDGGTTSDGGTATDAGTTNDGGTGSDGGSTSDGGTTSDGGSPDGGPTGPFVPTSVRFTSTAAIAFDATLDRWEVLSHDGAVLKRDDDHRLLVALSPDHTRLAYVALGASGVEVWVTPTDASEPAVRVGEAGRIERIDWTADGSRLVYAVRDETSWELEVVSVAADGTGQVSLARPVETYTISSLGRVALVTAPTADGAPYYGGKIVGADGTGEVDLLAALADTGVTGLYEVAAYDHPLAWSPDGSRLALVGKWPDPTYGKLVAHSNVYLVDPDGTNVVQVAGPTEPTLTAYEAFFVDWAPDGSRLAYHVDSSAQPIVHTVLPDGTGDVEADQRGFLAHIDGAMPSAWSPDGAYLAILALGRRLRVGASDTLAMTQVTELTGTESFTRDESRIAWSPDSQSIAYRSNQDGALELFVAAADGTNPTKVSQPLPAGAEVDPRFGWAPDSSFLVYTDGTDGYDVARPPATELGHLHVVRGTLLEALRAGKPCSEAVVLAVEYIGNGPGDPNGAAELGQWFFQYQCPGSDNARYAVTVYRTSQNEWKLDEAELDGYDALADILFAWE